SQTLSFLPAAAITCTRPGVTLNDATGNMQTVTLNHGCSVAGNVNVVPDAGIADVNPSLFFGTDYTSQLNSKPLFNVLFGVAASEVLYRELQVAQGKAQRVAGGIDLVNNATGAPGADGIQDDMDASGAINADDDIIPIDRNGDGVITIAGEDRNGDG